MIIQTLKDYIVVVTADHGEEFMEHGQLGHRADFKLTEELTHVPFIVGIT